MPYKITPLLRQIYDRLFPFFNYMDAFSNILLTIILFSSYVEMLLLLISFINMGGFYES